MANMSRVESIVDEEGSEKGVSQEPTVAPSTASIHSSGYHGKAEIAVTPTSQLPGSSTFKTVLLVFTMMTVMIVNSANATVVSISLPTIGRELQLSEGDLQWIVSAYPLSSGCLFLAFGRFADLYGRKLTFLAGSAFLTIFTLACAFPNDVVTLNILRAIQGLGAGAIVPAAVGILAHHFPPGQARSWAFATFSAGAPVGALFGSAIGGVLTETTAKTWRSNFYLMAGMTFLSLLCGIFCIRKDTPLPPGVDKRIDWLGTALVTAGLVLIVFVLGQGELAPQKWKTPYITALLILSVILVAAFLYWQHYLEKVMDDPKTPYSILTPPPLMKISIWKRGNGGFAAMMAIGVLEWCCFIAWTFWVQLYYQNYLGLTPLKTVLRILPMCVSGILCNVFVGFFISHIPLVWLVAIGTAATSVACLLFAVIDPNATFWAFGFPAAAIVVVGADFVFSAGTIYVARIALPEEQSVAGGMFNTMTQLGTAIGVTVTTVVFDAVRSKNGPGADQLLSYQAAQWAAFAFGIIATIIAVITFRGVGVVGDRKSKPDSLDEEALSKAVEPRETEEKR